MKKDEYMIAIIPNTDSNLFAFCRDWFSPEIHDKPIDILALCEQVIAFRIESSMWHPSQQQGKVPSVRFEEATIITAFGNVGKFGIFKGKDVLLNKKTGEWSIQGEDCENGAGIDNLFIALGGLKDEE